MDNNTVTLDLKRYHELDDLEKVIIAKDTIEMCTGINHYNGYTNRYNYRKFLDYGNMDKEKADKEKVVEPESTSDFSKMSIWAFMRWKKNNKYGK